MKEIYSTLFRFGAMLLLIAFTDFVEASFSAEKLRAGITESQLRAMVDADGYVLRAGEGMDTRWVYRKSNNEIVATYYMCQGKVYRQAITVSGGPAAYIKRVTQLNRQFGEGKVSVESAMGSVGERNSLEFVWRGRDEIITATYFAATPSNSESQWVSTAVPSICGK